MSFKTLCILGTRPEAIKMAPIIKALNQHPLFSNQLCVTGQHQQMLKSVLDLFEIHPDFDLEVMTINQDLSQLTAKMLIQLSPVLERTQPDLVLVHGDTTTTLAASLSAYYYKIPVAHIEAGLRTHHLYSPWPEEANRKLTGALATLHFAPTPLSRQNLLKEGVSSESIFVTGNTVIDALIEMKDKLEKNVELNNRLRQAFPFLDSQRKMILVTGHRRENFGQGFKNICGALLDVSKRFPEVDIVYPVHLNPNVQQKVYSLLSHIQNIHLIPPVDYLPFIYLMKASYFILTDSGGIQEEAAALKKPVLVMRETTERQEGVLSGMVKLVGTHQETIVNHVSELLTDTLVHQHMSSAINPYGQGRASKEIIQILERVVDGTKDNFSMTKHREVALV